MPDTKKQVSNLTASEPNNSTSNPEANIKKVSEVKSEHKESTTTNLNKPSGELKKTVSKNPDYHPKNTTHSHSHQTNKNPDDSNAAKTHNKFDKKNYYKNKFKEIESNINAKINENPYVDGKAYKNLVSPYKLLEIGTHIGLTKRKWNPKMKEYIYGKKGNNYIINIYQTLMSLNSAYNYLYDFAKKHEDAETLPILVVGTKGKVIKTHIKEQAKRTKCYYINERWLGGVLTNFSTILESIQKFNNLILLHKSGDLENFKKKERMHILKRTEKLAKIFSGIRTMKSLPELIILANPTHNHIALKEALNINIPVIAICNTNSNPFDIDYPIPANNNSIRTVYLILGILFDAIAEAKGYPMEFVGKKDDEIKLPEIIKKKLDIKKIPPSLRY